MEQEKIDMESENTSLLDNQSTLELQISKLKKGLERGQGSGKLDNRRISELEGVIEERNTRVT